MDQNYKQVLNNLSKYEGYEVDYIDDDSTAEGCLYSNSIWYNDIELDELIKVEY